jgi:hypothetical protein
MFLSWNPASGWSDVKAQRRERCCSVTRPRWCSTWSEAPIGTPTGAALFGNSVPPLVQCSSELDALSHCRLWIGAALTRNLPPISITGLDQETTGRDLLLPEIPALDQPCDRILADHLSMRGWRDRLLVHERRDGAERGRSATALSPPIGRTLRQGNCPTTDRTAERPFAAAHGGIMRLQHTRLWSK